jgi:hypothetical protein
MGETLSKGGGGEVKSPAGHNRKKSENANKLFSSPTTSQLPGLDTHAEPATSMTANPLTVFTTQDNLTALEQATPMPDNPEEIQKMLEETLVRIWKEISCKNGFLEFLERDGLERICESNA